MIMRRRHTDDRFDTSIPALLVMLDQHEWDYGAVATIRTLGRVGISTFATVGRPGLPMASSRYLSAAFDWPAKASEPESSLVRDIMRFAEMTGGRPVAIAGDDESALLLARNAEALRETVILPATRTGLADALASKSSLASVAARAGVETPRSWSPREFEDLELFREHNQFPLVLKNPDAFSRWTAPAVDQTRIVHHWAQMADALREWSPGQPLLVSEHIPETPGGDWYVELATDENGEPLVAFSGQKLRARPRGTGTGTLSESVVNQLLIDQAARLCRSVGYCGVADTDWRMDPRDGSFKLLDFNPRRGAHFALFRSTAGIDVVRALHLHLTGRHVPSAPQVVGTRHVVGPADQLAYLDDVRAGRRTQRPFQFGHGTERAWWSSDDVGPFARFVADLRPLRGGRASLLRQRKDLRSRQQRVT